MLNSWLILLTITAIAAKSDIERRFAQKIDKLNARDYLRRYTSIAHPAGSDNDKILADWTLEQFKSFGFESKLEEYKPLLNFPIERSLVLNSPTRYVAKLREEIVDEDETSHDQDAVPTFLGYSADGDIKDAQVVYANYCTQEDFKTLIALGIKVKGHLVLCRYEGIMRGLKVKGAQELGAIGVLIYSDPENDGYKRGKVYPGISIIINWLDGPWRPPSAVQRGSIQFLSTYPGDPLTPFVPAKDGVPRINITDANIPKIPALPISYEDAKPFLSALIGKGIKADTIGGNWQGGLDIPYWTGPFGSVDLKLTHEFEQKPIWNVISVIEGHREPDRAVIFGNHRDAWVFGATDPNSGSAVMMEMGRVFGKLLEEGWKPSRTIVLASWDAEEYGLIGSTEWVEEFSQTLNKTVIAYINVDTGVQGPNLGASASPSLANLIRDVAKELVDPNSGNSLYDTWLAQSPDTSYDGSETYPRVSDLGSGSDYTAFLQHVGIASMDLGFHGPYGFGDPGWNYYQLMVELSGTIVLRLATEDVLPFDYSSYVDAMKKYTRQIEKKLTQFHNNASIKPLQTAIEVYQNAVPTQKQVLIVQQDYAKGVRFYNDQLAFAERYFINMDGIPGREWFRHVIYAPGEWAGYAAQTFPSIHEAIEKGLDVEKAIADVVRTMNGVVAFWNGNRAFL
ncbi:hypothetical protein HDV02_001536 [Globomyces sp. JEL0801]|nr:hypothetical protein HDV02_001536 [Globomyces sp. JEL0801]